MSDWKTSFEAVAGAVIQPGGPEVTLSLHGENSDFVRFQTARVRQAGSVHQGTLTVRVLEGQRHAASQVSLTGDPSQDVVLAEQAVAQLQQVVPHCPEDPFLLRPEEPVLVVDEEAGARPDAGAMVEDVTRHGAGLDLVGIYAGGSLVRGYADSRGGRGWFRRSGQLLDWSLVHSADKAVKQSLAGATWSGEAFAQKLEEGRGQLRALARLERTVPPGAYRVYLAPAALGELLQPLVWEGHLGARSVQTRTSALTRCVEGTASFDPRVTLLEDTQGGGAPSFLDGGFRRPPAVTLLAKGQFGMPLVSPRSAKEYGLMPNAGASEMPENLHMLGGQLEAAGVLEALGTGVYVSNLWYTNWSDRNAARITGMTRFATFWVEDGKLVAPLSVMRFDDALYRVLGEGLEALTAETEFMPSASTYEERALGSTRLPGALVRDFRFTL